MTGIPEYGTGRHEDYLTWQDEERAAISAPAREFTAWADARCIERGDLYGWATMADAFAAGMQAQRNLDAAQPQPVAADVRGLLDPLRALAAKWDANAARNQRNGQSLIDQGDEYGNEGLAVTETLGACVVDLRAVLADAPPAPEPTTAHQEKGSPAR